MAIPAGFKLAKSPNVPAGFKVVPAPSQPAEPEEGFSIAETISNIPGSALQLGKDIIEPILHPIDTAKSLAAAGQGLVEKGVKNIAANIPEGTILSSLAEGIDLGQTENEEVVNAIGGFIQERYGSEEAFKKTVQEDPVGVLADVAGLFTGGSTLLPKAGKIGKIGQAVESVGKAIDPLNISASAVKSLAKSGKVIPQSLPEKILETAIKFPPKKVSQGKRASMIKTVLREGIMPTVAGLQKIADKMGNLNTSLDNIIDTATKSGDTIPKGVIFSELKRLRRDLGGVKINATADLRVIDKMAKDFDLNLRRLGKDRITPRELQDMKTDAYKRINFDIKSGTAEAAKSATSKAIAKGGKEALERLDPNVKGINEQMGSLLELSNEFEGVVSKLDNRNIISLDSAAKIAAGAATGTPIGAAIGTVAAIGGAPRVKARTALILENIRQNADTIEIINSSLPTALAGALLTQAGRLEDSLRERLEEE